MSENKYNKLDKLFRSRLKGIDKAAADGWNVPPPDLLEGALMQLPPKERNRKPFLFWLLGGLIILGLSIFSYQNHRTIAALNKQVDELTAEQKLGSSAVNTLAINETALNNSNINKVPKTKKEVKVKQSNNTNINGLIIKTQTPAITTTTYPIENVSRDKSQITVNTPSVNAGSDFADFTKSNISSNTISNPDKLSIIEVDNNIITKELDKRALVKESERLITLKPQTLLTKESNLPIQTEIPVIAESEFQKSFLVYGAIGQKISSTRMTGTEGFDFELNGYDNRYSGVNAALGGSFRISPKIGIHSDIGFYRINSESDFSDEVIYDKNNEEEDLNGSVTYRSSIDIESILGKFTSDMVMELQEQEIGQNEILTNNTNINQQINVLNWSAGLDYYLLNLGKLDVVAQAGLGLNHVIATDQVMDTDIYLDKEHMMSDSFKSSDMSSVNRNFLSVNFGVDLRYNLSDKLSIIAGSGLERSLNPINKNQDNSKTFLKAINTALKVGYRF